MSTPWQGAGRRIYMQEVGTRDGLQVEAVFVPTDEKIALVNALSRSGVSKIEVTAFVSPQAIPALRDAEIVMREIERRPGVVYSALVPNVRGAQRAIEARAVGPNALGVKIGMAGVGRVCRDPTLARLAQGHITFFCLLGLEPCLPRLKFGDAICRHDGECPARQLLSG